MLSLLRLITLFGGENTNDYENKVVQVYCEDPERWRKAIGNTLLFQFGVYDDPASRPLISLPEWGRRPISKSDKS
ncbi:hypothetical protein [Photorhabdus khanii]|uniref:hypothetical protein n=1 Tax=Photorhabdus khanii TaxID=1004150 RepID=UPI001EFFE9C2|nr:hypothetical protein [Photorhabdus khanii]